MDSIKAILLKVGIDLLKAILPMLAGMIGGPLGWLAGLAVSYLTRLLSEWAERYARFVKIDKDVARQVEQAMAAAVALKQAPEETRAQHIEKFREAVRDLTRFNVVQ